MTDRRWRHLLMLAFALVWTVAAVAPKYRADWAIENLLVAAFALLLILCRRVALSRLSATLLFAFLCFHQVGAHYTYSEVPYEGWLQALFPISFAAESGFERNQFDRLVHFLFGLLITLPVREVLLQTSSISGTWSRILPMTVIVALSAAYEIVEWGAAAVLGGDLGIAYVGAQGDVWDAQKDMALAAAGALLAMALTAIANAAMGSDAPSRV